jgi:hypothetical protein
MASQVGGGMRLCTNSNYIVQGSGSNDVLFFTSTSNQNIVFGTSNNSNLLMRINSNGYIGIGLSNPAFKLDILGDLNFTGALRQGGVPYVGSQWSNSSSNVFLLGSNVGIGVSAPLAGLHVACNLRVDGSVTMFNSISMPAVYFTPGNSANTNTSQIVLATSNIQGYSNLVWGASGSNGTQFSIMSNTSNDSFRWVSGAASNTVMNLSGNGNLSIAGTIYSSNDSFMRNRLVNGDMRIANRGTSVSAAGSVTVNAPCDQWVLNYSITTGALTMTQGVLTSSDTPYGSGFRYSLKIQATTACSSYSYIQPTQTLDPSVIADLAWGLASGVGVAVSFWMRTNLANSSVVSFSIRNGTVSYTYNAPVTVTNSGGWQYVSLVLPAPPTSAAWTAATEFMIGARYNTASATAGTWINNNFIGINGAVDLWATLNNYIEVTGVQLERGSVATAFEFRMPVVESLLNNNIVLGSVSAGTVGNICAGNLGMFRNRIINGDMRIAQRGTTGTVTAAGVPYLSVDRWFIDTNVSAGGVSLTRNSLATSDSPYLAGLQYYARLQGTGTQTYAWVIPTQSIEGYNITDLGWGASTTSYITLSFWLRTNLANGSLVGVALRNNASTCYVANVTVSATGTWQYCTLNIPPPPSASVWDSATGTGIRVCIAPAIPSGTATANIWNLTNNLTTSTAANPYTNSTNYVDFTGVQLEKGIIATPFEFRPYPIELQLCQRYFQNLINNVVGGGGYQRLCSAVVYSTGSVIGTLTLPATLRGSPTGTPTTNCMTLIESWTASSTASNAAWSMQYSGADYNGSTIGLYISNNTGYASQAAFLCLKMLNPAGSNYFYVSSEL